MARPRSLLVLALAALAALAGHGVAAAYEVAPFLLCHREAALELAAAYQKSEQEAGDAMLRLAVAERCFRHPPGWSFEVAEIAAGPLFSYDGQPFYVVMIDTDDGRALYGLTWPTHRGPTPKRRPI